MGNGNTDLAKNAGLEALAKVSGLGKDEIAAIAAEVKANNAKLNSCSYHEFEPTGAESASMMRQKYQCKNCSGVIDRVAYLWHERGRRKNPAEYSHFLTKVLAVFDAKIEEEKGLRQGELKGTVEWHYYDGKVDGVDSGRYLIESLLAEEIAKQEQQHG